MSDTSKNINTMPSHDGLINRLKHHENTTMLFVLLLIIFVVFVIDFFTSGMVLSNAKFISGLNISNVLLQVAVTGILALGMTLVMLMGGIDLSIGWMMCFIGTGMAYLMRNFGLPAWIVIILAIIATVFFQMIMGLIISRTKLESFIVSLGVHEYLSRFYLFNY